MTAMVMQISRNDAWKTTTRAERENALVRRLFGLGGHKQLAATLRIKSLNRARDLFYGRARLNDDELDALEALFGHDVTDALAAPNLAAFIARERAKINETKARIAAGAARLGRVSFLAGGSDCDPG